MSVTDKCETSRLVSPPIPRYKDINDLSITVKKGKKVICTGPEGDVEDEERVGVTDVWGSRAPEVRHAF